MRFLQLAPIALCAALVAGTATAQQLDPANKTQMRQLVTNNCSPDEAKACACLADNMVKNFTTKEWTIFIAASQNADVPPAGTTEEDIVQMTTKLINAAQTCQPGN